MVEQKFNKDCVKKRLLRNIKMEGITGTVDEKTGGRELKKRRN